MKNKEEFIWKYLDQQLNEEEQARVEQALETDDDLRELLGQSRLLHQNLQQMETESPSLRFAQNVMDRLPAVKNLATGPLISTKWLRGFYGGVLATLLLVVSGGLWLAPAGVSADSEVENIVNNVRPVFDLLPTNALLFPGIILISLLLLLSLDRWLQRRFQRS